MNIPDNLIPQSPIEQAIYADLLQLQQMGSSLTPLQDDLKDDPDSYAYTEDDLQQFLFANNITQP